MTPEERDELLTGYALGSLSAPDAAAAEELIRRDASAAVELAELHEVVELIALSVPLKRADPSLRGRVFEAIRTRDERSREAGGARSPSRLHRVTRRIRYAIPLVALAAGLGIVSMWGMNLQAELDVLRADTASLTAVVEAAAKELDRNADASRAESESLSVQLATVQQQQQSIASIQSDPAAVTTILEATRSWYGDAGGAYTWSATAGTALVAMHDLPTLPIGGVYRVWVEGDTSEQVLAETFIPDADGAAVVVLEPRDGAQPTRIYIVASGSLDTDGDQGPVILQALIGR